MEPNCIADYPACQSENGGLTFIRKLSVGDPKRQVDWERIDMGSPKWLFDGRCIIDTKMTRLGVRVQSIGSVGNSS